MSDLDCRCIELDAEMEMSRFGDQCSKKNPDAEDPCDMCNEYGFCFRAPATNRRSELL